VASPCHAAAKSTSLLTLKMFKEGAFPRVHLKLVDYAGSASRMGQTFARV
jgi:hypothetical protein